MKKYKNKIPTLIGILLLTVGVVSGVFLVQNRQSLKSSAAPESTPKNVKVTNISDSSFSVSWTTDKPTIGSVVWGKNEKAIDNTILDEINKMSETHLATIRFLSPQSVYFFKIKSADIEYDNNSVAWSTTTASPATPLAKTTTISGSVADAAGNPVSDALVYVTLPGSSTLSTKTSQSGGWVLPLSEARSQDLTSYASFDESTSVLDISVQAGSRGVASALSLPKNSQPTPPIIIGQTNDFRNLPLKDNTTPSATVELPKGKEETSKFEINEQSLQESTTVTLDSITEGEVITSTEPEFFGKGPVGVVITITVESNPITDTTNTSPDGTWQWSPPEGLEAGTHTVTITWKDANQIIRKLTRTFEVAASEGPAFESTPSATPTPSTSPSPTPTPTATISATPTPSSTPSTLPDAGTLTPTVILAMMGLAGLVSFGVLSYATKENA